MANFEADRTIYLQGFTPQPVGAGASWTGILDLNVSNTVVDADANGILSTADYANGVSVKYTGYYVEIGGNHYGIFFSGSGNAIIPYNSTLSGGVLSFPTGAGSTILYDETLDTAANCFLTGTRIATPTGERAIDSLRPGDLVLTAEGDAAPILWVWRQEITNIFGLGEARTPIRVAAHALGPDCPARDLIVTADHALVVDGFLINAGALVNGTTIAPVPLARMPARFTYWHIETEAHVALMAENCPSESFIDYTPREGFDNFDDYLAQGGTEPIIEEMPMPRISTQRLLLPALRRRLGIDRVA